PSHTLEYVVEVVSRDAKGSATCWCLFCVHEGRNEVKISQNGRKRKRTAQIKMFTAPFYPHKYRNHHESQHAESWVLYQDLSKANKKQYFLSQIKTANTLHRHMTMKDDKLVFNISARILDTIIGDLFFRDDEVLATADSDGDSDDDMANTIVKKAAKTAKEKTNALKLFVKNENNPDWYQHARDHTKTATLSGMNDLIAGQYVRVLVSGNLQDISDLMGDLSIWAFSFAFDSSTHFEQSFFALHVRICFKGRLCNLHLVGLPLFARHTAEILYNLLCKFLDALYPDWRVKLLNTSSDGENTMTGCHIGLITRIARCAKFNVLRVWCVPHQIDIIVKSSAEGINGGAYVKDVYSFSVHLRSQHNLIIQMGVKCPKKTNRWVHLGRVLNFYKQWVITYAIAPIVDEIYITFAKLQSRSLLVAQQVEFVDALIGTLTAMFYIEVIDPDQSDDDDGEIEYMLIESMRINIEIALYAIMLVMGLTGVKAERDENNQPLDHNAPPFWTFDECEEIEVDHRDLVKMYHDDENMRNVIHKHDINTLLNDAWDCVPRFKRLRAFCGGLATIFPNTTSVENDFLILKWELDAFRTALMHLSLEGIMQAKQRAILKQLWA
ncbi:hypothetical protein CY35_17G098500, partial [Sphagnum magellanicum]